MIVLTANKLSLLDTKTHEILANASEYQGRFNIFCNALVKGELKGVIVESCRSKDEVAEVLKVMRDDYNARHYPDRQVSKP